MSYAMVDLYIESRSLKVSEITSAHARDVIERILDNLVAKYDVKVMEEMIVDLTPTKLQRWYNAICKERKAATVNNYVCMLNPFLRWCFTLDYTGRDFSNILHTVKLPDPESLPPEERPKDKYLSHEQVEQLLHCYIGKNCVRDRAIMALILYSGLRVSEICSMTMNTIADRKNVVVKRKGGHYKQVFVGDAFWPYLDAYLKTRSDRTDPNAPLFVTSRGQPCSRNQIYKSFATKQSELGLATGPHALRHTFVSEVENTCGAGVARDCANHKSLAITNRYDHTTPLQRQTAVNKLDW